MEKDSKRLVFCSTPIIFLPLLFLALDFFWGNTIPFHQWITSFNGGNPINKTLQHHDFINSHIARLVRGEDRRTLDSTGLACDKKYHSIVCVSNKPVTINTADMTVYVPSHHLQNQETVVVRPYARQEDELSAISPVRMVQYANTTAPPPCLHHHRVPAVIFSSGSTGNAFHEMNEIIIPLYITTRQFQSRVVLIIEDYKPSFMAKYGKILSLLSDYPAMDAAKNGSVHCFPGTIVGLKYHDNLALNSSDIPGGYGMQGFRHFLRQAYGMKFEHVPRMDKPRLMLLSRTKSRRILNEDEVVEQMKDIGFEVVVIKRSKVVSNLIKFTRLINSCSVLVGAHGAGLTNEIFLPEGAVMIQIELIGTGWASDKYYGDTAAAMGVKYLRYKIEAEESSLAKVYGRNHSYITDPTYLFLKSGYRAARAVYLDTQNVRVNLDRFRQTLVEAYSIVTDWTAR